VAVFKRSLSLDEINTLYNIGRGVVQAVPPAFSGEPPSPKALYAGRTAQFKALATGSAPLTYRWRKNGVNISDGANISGAETDSLTIPPWLRAMPRLHAGGDQLRRRSDQRPAGDADGRYPSGKAYEAAVRLGQSIACRRLKAGDRPPTLRPSTTGGLVGSIRDLRPEWLQFDRGRDRPTSRV
jgi:hypothetical protein